MAGLVLKLAPNERVLINGVVVENGDRKSSLKIMTPEASILRLRDALHPEEARTPVTRAYYIAQLCVAGSADLQAARVELEPMLAALAHAFEPLNEGAAVRDAQEQLARGRFYSVMRALKPLIDVEARLLELSNGGAVEGQTDGFAEVA